MSSERNAAVDVVRLLALTGICVVNLPFFALPTEATMALPPVMVDRLAMMLVELLFQAKFFLLFSFIFGWGMEIQSLSAERAGASFNRRFARRLALLALLGGLHVLLVFVGDILLLYALLGLLAWPLRRKAPGLLLKLAAGLVALALAGTLALGLVLLVAGDVGAAATPNLGGTYLDTVTVRLRDWPSTFAFLALFQGPLALAAFLTGIVAARGNFFQPDSPARQRLHRALPGLLLAGLLFNLAYVGGTTTIAQPGAGLLSVLGIGMIALGGPVLAAAYLAALLWLADRWQPPALLLLAGRNSLSCYVIQGVIAGALFGGYGLGWYNSLGHAALLGLSLLVALSSMILTGLYARHFGRGPLEALLRRFTYG
ncbi:DUF418 domain-containing protein [Niveispirillum lacus]|uniref:DUF418 domain-containing protein n=1 Tax=Niveispirillum lacus TaxID=1981099 RepID=UPI0010543450|nr:DUF418 domain-containing protein [Niveispirillum lacus]